MNFNKLLLSLVINSALALSQAFAGSQPDKMDWGMYQGNAQHTGYVDIALKIMGEQILWSRKLSDEQFGHEIKPVVANKESVFITVDNKLYRLDSITGEIIWSKEFSDLYNLTAPTIDTKNLYIRTVTREDWNNHKPTQGELISYNIVTGNLNFKKVFDSASVRNYSPTVYQGKVYTTCGNYNDVCAFEVETGELLWSQSLSFYQKWTPSANNKYVITQTDVISVFDKNNGEIIFEYGDHHSSSAAPYQDSAAVIGNNDDVICIHRDDTTYGDSKDVIRSVNLISHKLNWEHKKIYQNPPAVGGEVVYAALRNGDIDAYSEQTGEWLWTWRNESVSRDVKNLVLFKNMLIVSTNMDTYAINLDSHKTIWSYPKGGYISYSNGLLYLGSTNGTLYAFKVNQLS